LNAESILSIGYGLACANKLSLVNREASLNNVDGQTVQRCSKRLAATYLEMQRLLLKQMRLIAIHFRLGIRPRTFGSLGLAYDETEHPISVPWSSDLSESQTRSKHHVLVGTSRMMNGRVSRADPSSVCRNSLNVVRPNVVVAGVAAEHVYHGLFLTPEGAHVEETFAEICRQCDFPSRAFNRDGASACSRCNAKRSRAFLPHVPTSDGLCNLHKVKHVESAMILATNTDVTARMYSLAKHFQTGGYYAKFLLDIDSWVNAEHVHIIRGKPPPINRVYAGHVIDFICDVDEALVGSVLRVRLVRLDAGSGPDSLSG
jgi:hypothetical protein